jgi:PKD repeat protein
LHPAFSGDSGSAVVMGGPTDPTGTVVEGTGAIGILTHIGVPFGTAAGTFVDHAVVMATQADMDLAILTEGQPLVLPDITANFDADVAGFQVAFTDRSFSPDGIVSWHWIFGDGVSSVEQNPMHAYAAEGTYDVHLAVTDSVGASAEVTKTIEVTNGLDPSTPSLANGETVTVTVGGEEPADKHFKIQVPGDATGLDVVMTGPPCDLTSCPLDADLYVRYDERATDDAYDCRPFLMGNDESCSMPNPAAGLWYVRVHAFSGSGSVQLTATHDGSMNQDPVASFTHETTNLTTFVNASASSDPDGDALSYSWDFGDGATANGVTALHTYEAGGTYTVTLTVDDGNGGTATQAQDVTVTAPPASWQVWLHLTGPDGVVLDWVRVATVDAGSAGDWSYLWEPATPTEGSYTVTVRLMEDQAIRAEDDVSFLIDNPNEAPSAFLSADPSSGMVPLDVDFTLGAEDQDGSIASWSLDFGDGSEPVAGEGAPPAEATHTYTEPGNYTARLTVADDEAATAEAHVLISAEAFANQAPTASIDGPEKTATGTVNTFDGSGSSDPDGTIVSWVWDMGDGTALEGATVAHAYEKPGKKDVSLTVTDDDGATATATFMHVAQGKPAA